MHDVFLSHNSADKPMVEEIARRLRKEGIEPWLDKWDLIPGVAWKKAIEQALDDCASCAVFIGPEGLGSWHEEEMYVAIARRVREGHGRFRVIPVLLPGVGRPERGKLPSFLTAVTWVEFRTLDDGDALHRLTCGIRGIEPDPHEPLFEGQCPYRGLEVFDEAHARFFFGREALTEWLLNALRPSEPPGRENRFLAILGPSGGGKSSLALAGLVPALRQGKLPESAAWPIVTCRPGPDPLESLAVKLAGLDGGTPDPSAVLGLAKSFGDDPRALHLFARLALRDAPAGRRLVVLVDQFEEVFTLCDKDRPRRALIENLHYAACLAGGQAVVVLTMRADFYGRCAPYSDLAAAMSDHQVLVGPMGQDELRRAIERPARMVGCEFEPGLVETLLNDVKQQPGTLPLLQFALKELWQRRDGCRLTGAAYQDMGALQGALENRADAILRDFSAPERELCRRIFLRLTQPGEGTEDTKRRASIRELISSEGEAATIRAVVDRLADARLVTTEGDERHTEEGFVEVAHEALIRGWPELRHWIDADRAGLRTHRRLTEAAREWEGNGRDPSDLYTGTRMAVAREWSESHRDDLNPLERDFLEACRKRQRDERWKRAALATAALVGVLAVGGGVLGFELRERARQATTSSRVHEELNEARRLGNEAQSHSDLARWDEAVSAARRAENLVQSGGDTGALRAQVAEVLAGLSRRRVRARKDAEARAALDEARFLSAQSSRKDVYDFAGTIAAYRAAFRDYGIDVESLSLREAEARIRASAIREELTAALDDWATLTERGTPTDRASLPRLVALARAVDPDEFRNALRDAIAKDDAAAIKRLARDHDLTKLPRSTLRPLSSILTNSGEANQAVTLLRPAQQLYPGDFWINNTLGTALIQSRPPQYAEAIRYLTAALAIRPESARVYYKLGYALSWNGQGDEAIAALQRAIALKPDYVEAICSLGYALDHKGHRDEAIAAYKRAIALEPNYLEALNGLGYTLRLKGGWDEAITVLRRAIALKPDFAEAYYNLGAALAGKGQWDETIAALNRAIALQPDYVEAHKDLGLILMKRGRLDEAIAEFRRAIALQPDHARTYFRLGLALMEEDHIDEAIDACRKAIALKPDYAEAHCNLGLLLEKKAQYADALAELTRGHELGPRDPNWSYPSAQWIRDCQRLIAIDGRLTAALHGTGRPADADEQIEFAGVCNSRRLFGASARYYEAAFAARPELAGDIQRGHRYNAACVAALASDGQGSDSESLEAPTRARLRTQALAWLRADLADWTRVLDGPASQFRDGVRQILLHSQRDPDLAGLREADALAKLPEADRAACNAFWAEVKALAARTGADDRSR